MGLCGFMRRAKSMMPNRLVVYFPHVSSNPLISFFHRLVVTHSRHWPQVWPFSWLPLMIACIPHKTSSPFFIIGPTPPTFSSNLLPHIHCRPVVDYNYMIMSHHWNSHTGGYGILSKPQLAAWTKNGSTAYHCTCPLPSRRHLLVASYLVSPSPRRYSRSSHFLQ